MTRDTGRRQRGSSTAARDGRARRLAYTLALEPLEERRLLSQFYSGPSATRPIQTSDGVFTLSVSGPGLEKVHQLGHGEIGVTLFGTNQASTLNVSLTRQYLHKSAAVLQIGSIKIDSGLIGGIQANGAVLDGTMTPLTGAASSLQFGGLGPNTQIDVDGDLGSLNVAGTADLGADGHVNITGDVTQGLALGALTLAGGKFSIGGDLAGTNSLGNVSLSQGGQFTVGNDISGGAQLGALSISGAGRFVVTHDISGTLSASSINLSQGGQFLVGHDVATPAQVAGALSVTGNSLFSIGDNLAGLTVGQDFTLDSGGQFTIGSDLTGPLTVDGNLGLSNSARLIVNRDATGAISVNGNLNIAAGGTLSVGRTLSALSVNGDLAVAPAGGGIDVGGNLDNLTVTGAFSGQGSPTAIDLNVGLDLGDLVVEGGGANQGGLQSVDINVGKNIQALSIAHGIFNSLITAGVSIVGGSNTNGVSSNIGADGTDAVYNSQILAGSSITNLTIGGNVDSTFATNPASTGYPTRIIAGVDRQGTFAPGGLIDNFQITGALINSVVAASVAPSGGAGALPTTGYGALTPRSNVPGDGGFNTYDAPAGTITGGTVGNPVKYPNYTELDYYNETLTGVSYNTAIDPTIDDYIYPGGAINPSFASPPLTASDLSNATTVTTNTGSATYNGTTQTTTVSPSQLALPLPTKSTVLGGVISTAHGDNADFAGLFAADTSGVFIGPLPTSTSS